MYAIRSYYVISLKLICFLCGGHKTQLRPSLFYLNKYAMISQNIQINCLSILHWLNNALICLLHCCVIISKDFKFLKEEHMKKISLLVILAAMMLVVFVGCGQRAPSVITSYSIHYTKLYDCSSLCPSLSPGHITACA